MGVEWKGCGSGETSKGQTQETSVMGYYFFDAYEVAGFSKLQLQLTYNLITFYLCK